LLRLVRGLLPVPRVLDAQVDQVGGDPTYLLTERLPGINLQDFLTTADDRQRESVGVQLGELLVRLSGMPFLSFGEFHGSELRIESFGSGGLAQWLNHHVESFGLSREQVDSLRKVIDRAEDLADSGVDRFCLVHSDFNPKNLLVDPDTARITGLIDWEFAHAGTPYADLGNLLRFGTDPGGRWRPGAPGCAARAGSRILSVALWACATSDGVGSCSQQSVGDSVLSELSSGLVRSNGPCAPARHHQPTEQPTT
jgi:aminoglycoside phosphotransferase (APT) family kinase protein